MTYMAIACVLPNVFTSHIQTNGVVPPNTAAATLYANDMPVYRTEVGNISHNSAGIGPKYNPTQKEKKSELNKIHVSGPRHVSNDYCGFL